MNINSMQKIELELTYYAALGYENFDYYEEYNCWKAEKKIGEFGFKSIIIIADTFGAKEIGIYRTSLTADFILRDMQNENIGLCWDQEGNYELYFQAFTEIRAKHHWLEQAYMMILIKKEYGEALPLQVIDFINLNKIRLAKGSPI